MKIIEKYLTAEELAPIQFLIGQNVYEIFTDVFHAYVDQHFYESSSFSFSIDSGFFCIQTFCKELDNYEYYEFELSIQKDPIGIERTKEGYLINPATILMLPSSKIKTIELFTKTIEAEGKYLNEGSEREQIIIKYDYNFVFTQENGNAFLIEVSETMGNLTEFIRDKKTIQNRIEGLEKRLEWK